MPGRWLAVRPRTIRDAEAGDGSDGTDDADASDGGGSPALGDEPLDLGEAVVFYTEDGSEELSFWLGEPVLTPVLVTDRQDQGLISSDHPDEDTFLTVEVGLENTGEGVVDMPSSVDLVMDGTTYSHKRTALTDEYDPFAEVQPGETARQTLVFDVPEPSETGRISVEWGRLETATAEWAVDLGSVERQPFEFDALTLNESITIGTSAVQYTLSAEDVTEERASDDATSVYVTLRAENTGRLAAQDPTLRGTSLLADGETFEERSYDGDDAFDVDELAPGEVETGVLAFRVPADVDDYRFRTQLTMELTATWVL